MTSSAGPWSVKGIDPKAREMAKDLARRSGMTLGEWLNQMIVDGGETDAPPFESQRLIPEPLAFDSFRRNRATASAYEPNRTTSSLEALTARLEAAEHRSTLAISGIDQSVMGVLSRIEGVERDQSSIAAHFEGQIDEVRDAQGRIGERLRRIGDDEAPRQEAFRALEASLGKIAGQLHDAEARARAGLSEIREDVAGAHRRIERLETRPESADAEMVARLAERLAEAENRTSAAVRALEISFAGLDARLALTETDRGPDGEAERRFGRLAAELSDKVEAARSEMAQKLNAGADGKLERVEASLAAMNGHVQAAEQRSADAIDRMGREVVRIAHSMGARVQAVETRGAQAVEQVGGEMARLADAMEARTRSADAAQAEALEKLGAEIGRIAEKLADRIAATERRSALAIDEVGDQVIMAAEKIQQRYDNIAGDLADRIRQSEERTSRVLDEARAKLEIRREDAPREHTQGGVAVEVAAAARAEPAVDPHEAERRAAVDAAVASRPEPAVDLSPAPAYTPPQAAAPQVEPEAHAPPPYEAPSIQAFAAEAPAGTEADEEPFDTAAFGDVFESELLADDDGFVSLPTGYAETEATDARFEDLLSSVDDPFAEPRPEPTSMLERDFGQTEPAGGRTGNRDLLDAARQAARQASDRGRRGPIAPPQPEDPSARRAFTFGLPRKKRKDSGPTLRTALLASGTAATLSMAVAGYGLLSANHATESAKVPATADPVLAGSPSTSTLSATPLTDQAALAPPPAVAPLSTAGDTLAVALTPPPQTAVTAAPSAARPVLTPPAATPAPVAAAGNTRALYVAAVRQIESGDPTGLDPLRRAANLGDAASQFYLSKLYETGGAGLRKDIVEARRWTERAAQGGDPKAMHNLGLYFFEGAGGQKSVAEAAAWFRRAADLGLQDSQYNLARLYEEGFGVARNAAEAYKWYLIAGGGGDAESKSSAERVRKLIPTEAQVTAQRSAAGFRAQLPSAARSASAQ